MKIILVQTIGGNDFFFEIFFKIIGYKTQRITDDFLNKSSI
ncbi:MAG: hypothetical protein ACJAUD_001049 [Crocinitomicaceae bacterium]|jgi:hypothetical protein